MARVPFKCPICHGRGKVPAGFYSDSGVPINTAPEQCTGCGGSGIIWGVGTDPQTFEKVSEIKGMVQLQEDSAQ